MNELRYCVGNMGLEGEGDDGEGGTLVDPVGLSGELGGRDIPTLDKGRRVKRSGEDDGRSRSPYSDRGRRLGAEEDDSGEFGTVVWFVVTERIEFSEETEEPVELGLILSRVFDLRRRTEDV